jgi:hypothetical protein
MAIGCFGEVAEVVGERMQDYYETLFPVVLETCSDPYVPLCYPVLFYAALTLQ